MFADEYASAQHRDTAPMLSALQRCTQPCYLTGGVEVDRLCRSITQAVKDTSSAFIMTVIGSDLR